MGGERHCGGQSAGHRVISARSTDFRVSLTILRTLVSAFRSIDGKLRQSEQACQYRPRQRKYPGDEMCRDATTENRKRRKSPSASGGDQYIVQADILAARSSAGAGRLCSHDFQELRKHMNSVERKGGTKTKGTRPSKCAACGKDTYFMCMLCDKPVCFRGSKGCETWDCIIMDLHDEECFGLLLRCDATVAKNWKKPSARQRLRHADYVQNIMN